MVQIVQWGDNTSHMLGNATNQIDKGLLEYLNSSSTFLLKSSKAAGFCLAVNMSQYG